MNLSGVKPGWDLRWQLRNIRVIFYPKSTSCFAVCKINKTCSLSLHFVGVNPKYTTNTWMSSICCTIIVIFPHCTDSMTVSPFCLSVLQHWCRWNHDCGLEWMEGTLPLQHRHQPAGHYPLLEALHSEWLSEWVREILHVCVTEFVCLCLGVCTCWVILHITTTWYIRVNSRAAFKERDMDTCKKTSYDLWRAIKPGNGQYVGLR